MDWLKKFVINRALYVVLLAMLCIGIFPFVTLYCLTGVIGDAWKKVSPTSKLAEQMERVWDAIGAPYDALVKMVG